MLGNEQRMLSFGSSLTLPMCLVSIWNINGKLQTHRGQVFASKYHLEKIGAVLTNLTYGGNVVNYIIPHEYLYIVQSTVKLATKIPIKERWLWCHQREIWYWFIFLVGLNIYVIPKHAWWQLEPPPLMSIVTCRWWTPSMGAYKPIFTYLPQGQAPMFPYMVGWKHSIHSHAPTLLWRGRS